MTLTGPEWRTRERPKCGLASGLATVLAMAVGIALAAVGTLAAVGVGVSSAAAEAEVGGSATVSWYNAVVRPGGDGLAPQAGDRSDVLCWFYALDEHMVAGAQVTAPDLVTGTQYYRECRWVLAGGALGALIGDEGIYTKIPNGWAAIDDTVLIQELLARVIPIDPVPTLSPPADSVLVGLPAELTLETELQPIEAVDSVLGAAVGAITATPVQVIWDPNVDDARPAVTCGVAVDDVCSWTYGIDSADVPGGAFASSLAVRYEISWVLNIAGTVSSGTLPDLVAITDFSVAVNEVEAVLD